MSRKPYQKTWAELRMYGYRRCMWKVKTGRKAARGVGENRETAGRLPKGRRCRIMVSPTQIERMGGMPVCPNHKEDYEQAKAGWEEIKAVLREKYDPGPLPTDEQTPIITGEER